MSDRGFFLTWQAISRQLAAMPAELVVIMTANVLMVPAALTTRIAPFP